MEKVNKTRLIDLAWIRNGSTLVTGEALILATLMHTQGKSRRSDDMKTVQKIMKDVNLDKKRK